MAISFSNYRSNQPRLSTPSFKAATARSEAEVASFEEAESCFRAVMEPPLKLAAEIGEAGVVVGVPFYNEADTIGSVLKTVSKGLEEFYPERKCVIVAAGSPEGGGALKVINALPQSEIKRIAFLLDDERVNGRGWAIRAIFEIARSLGADLAIIEADLRSRRRGRQIEGLAPEWVKLLLEPIKRDSVDMVISRFTRYYGEAPISTHVFYPLLTAIYNCPVHDMGGQWGISHRLVRTYLKDVSSLWGGDISDYGIDSWLVTAAITSGARICEANLGIKVHIPTPEKVELVLRRVARVLFDQIVADKEWWRKPGILDETPLLQPLATFGARKAHSPAAVETSTRQLISRYRRGFNRFYSLYANILPQDAYRQLERLARAETRVFVFPPKLWAQVVYHFLLGFAFRRELDKDDLLYSFIPIFEGCVAGFALEIQDLRSRLVLLLPDEVERMSYLAAEQKVEEMVGEFIRLKPDFLAAWEEGEEAFKPPVPKVTYREFIPGVPLVVPLELTSPDGKVLATAAGVYDAIFNRHEKGFEHFIYDRLGTPREASSEEIAGRISDFMHQVEEQLGKILLRGDLFTLTGTRRVAEAVFRHFPHEDTYALTPEMASWLLRQDPPSNLLTRLGCANLDELLSEYEPNNALALASWSEEQEYLDKMWSLVRENARPEHFAPSAIRPVVVSHKTFPALVEMKEIGALSKLAGRIVVTNLHKGMGGEFPKLRYFTVIAKDIIEIERFGRIWQRFAAEGIGFGEKVINSLEGHWGREPLSAHNIFESGHQRVLVDRLWEMAQRIAEEAGEDEAQLSLAENLRTVADSYHLALTLPDGTFVPCSVWTWASFSFKGGRGVPTPLSLHVERDWSSQEFLTEYFKAAGGDEAKIEEKITDLMEEGREWEDLSSILLGPVKEAKKVVPEQIVTPTGAVLPPPAGALVRFDGNPILEPVREHPWESKWVFNAGAINLEGRIHLIYRAVGEDNISRFGLAISEDGFKFTERLERPIFEPRGRSEKRGCEDPRLTRIGNRIYMVYTAYDGIVAQIALASIRVSDFLNRRWEAWRRHGLVFPGFTDKDGALFPERFDGQFAMLHRVEPHIWITFSPHLRCPWPRTEHRILAGSTSGMMWDGHKIGASAQPIKTRYGWLLITHGVDHAYVYRLGVMLLDLANPTALLYRSPNPILEPQEQCEIGEVGECWVHNVVFTCGAVPKEGNKEILDADDELLVYYGAADSVISVATARVADLLPPAITQAD